MVRGIAIFGMNGGGKSTLAHALAKRIGFFELDAEDYYFPEQRASRAWSLENDSIIETAHLGELPFSVSRTHREVEAAIIADIQAHQQFIIAGVTMNWSEEILSRIDIAFWVQTPMEERLKRIESREIKRFGARVLAGGDMYEQQAAFRSMVQNRDPGAVEQTAKNFICPVIVLDGTLPVEENLRKIEAELNALQKVNILAKIARNEAQKFYHGYIMGTESNIDEIVRLFPKWNKKEADALWCAAFVLYCCNKAGYQIPYRPAESVSCTLAGCPAWEEWALSDNRISYLDRSAEPQAGDIVIFDNVFCDSPHDHMGIVVDVMDDTIVVAEGNFNNVSCIVERSRDEHIRCYIRIPEGFIY